MSIAYAVLSGARSVVLGLPLFSGFAPSQSAIRLRPFASRDHGDSFPFLCFSVGREVPGKTIRTTESQVGMAYPITVAYFYQKGADLEDQALVQAVLDAREAIRHALWQPHAYGVPGQVDIDYDPDPPYDLGALDASLVVSLQVFTPLVVENR